MLLRHERRLCVRARCYYRQSLQSLHATSYDLACTQQAGTCDSISSLELDATYAYVNTCGYRDKMAILRKEIEAVRAHRSSQRKRRRVARMPSVALIGYTNAGKSTLLNSLTAAGVLAEDSLFATLDPTVRRIVMPTGKLALLSDTVGFIQKLPTQLVDAFRATLEEIKVWYSFHGLVVQYVCTLQELLNACRSS